MKANDQQERLKMGYWISGFVDGEGCFTVSILKNSTTKYGKQIFPEFVITQSGKSLNVLEDVCKFFGIGSIVLNKRYDNHTVDLYKFCVRSISDLHEKIVPFFEEFSLRTSKVKDFIIFSKIVKSMYGKKHLSKRGFNRIVKLIQTMNRKKTRF